MTSNGEDDVAHDFAVLKDAIGERSRRIQGLLNVGQRENRCAVALPSLGPDGDCSRAARRSPTKDLRVAWKCSKDS